MSVTMEANFDLGKINLDLTKELNLAGQIIHKDHIHRLERGLDVNNNQMTPLKDATIKRKGFNQILVDKGEMRNLNIKKATKSKQEVILNPGDKKKRGKVTSKEIGTFHQFGKGNNPKREWFGISERASKDATKMIEMRIAKELKNA